MLGWFDLHLKGIGDGSSRKENPFDLLPGEKLLVFEEAQRDPLVLGIAEYCRVKGLKLRQDYLRQTSIDKQELTENLKTLLKIEAPSEIQQVHTFSPVDGWDRIALETTDKLLIPLLIKKPTKAALGYAILSSVNGKQDIASERIDELTADGQGVVIVELSGTGEAASQMDQMTTRLTPFHTLARARLWLGETMLGQWVVELDLVTSYLKENYNPMHLTFEGEKEAGLAGLFLAALDKGGFSSLSLRNTPVSYLFDNREGVDYFSMAIHLPGLLKWGDISLAAGLSGQNINFVHPVTMSGKPISSSKEKELQSEFTAISSFLNENGSINFQF
jgi:hypothetical protein